MNSGAIVTIVVVGLIGLITTIFHVSTMRARLKVMKMPEEEREELLKPVREELAEKERKKQEKKLQKAFEAAKKQGLLPEDLTGFDPYAVAAESSNIDYAREYISNLPYDNVGDAMIAAEAAIANMGPGLTRDQIESICMTMADAFDEDYDYDDDY